MSADMRANGWVVTPTQYCILLLLARQSMTMRRLHEVYNQQMSSGGYASHCPHYYESVA